MAKIDIRRLDFVLLMIFSEIMLRRKTTLVADALSLSQSTISHSLGRLRDIFGEELFIRTGNSGLEPTSLAREMAPEIEQLLTIAKSLSDTGPRFDPLTATSHFRLCGTIYPANILPPQIAIDLRQSAPDTTFSFGIQSKERALESLRRDEADLAFLVGPIPSGFDHIGFLSDSSVVAVRKNHPLVQGQMDLQTYLSLNHLNGAPDASLLGGADDALATIHRTRHVVAGISDVVAALRIVASTDMAMTLPKRLASPYISLFNFEIFPSPLGGGNLLMSIVRHQRSRGDSALAWLVQRLILLG